MVVSRFFNTTTDASDPPVRVDEAPLSRALESLSRLAARKGEYEAQCAAAAAVLAVAESTSDEALAASAVQAVQAELARLLVNMSSSSRRAKPHASTAAAARVGPIRAEVNKLRAEAKRLASRLGAAVPHAEADEGAAALAETEPPATSLDELRARCAVFRERGCARHICAHLCYLREYEPTRVRRAFTQAAIASTGAAAGTAVAGSTFAAELWQWRAELVLGPSGRAGRMSAPREGVGAAEWSVVLLPPVATDSSTQPAKASGHGAATKGSRPAVGPGGGCGVQQPQQRYCSVPEALAALGLGAKGRRHDDAFARLPLHAGPRTPERSAAAAEGLGSGGESPGGAPLPLPPSQSAHHRSAKRQPEPTPRTAAHAASACGEGDVQPMPAPSSSRARARSRGLLPSGTDSVGAAGDAGEQRGAERNAAAAPSRLSRVARAPASPYGLLEELMCEQPFALLLCCILLNQTQRRQVDRVLHALLAQYGSAAAMAAADEGQLAALLRPLGLHRRRARTLIAFAAAFLRDEWLRPAELPGVGRYGQDAYDIFYLGRWDQVTPSDHALSSYCDWVRGNDPDPTLPPPPPSAELRLVEL